MKLNDIGEFGFIDRIAPGGITRPMRVVKGIGDDCAVIEIDGPNYLLVTTDLLVERVHFVLDWAIPELFGAKALAIQLSDIAACGGRPLDAFVSLAIPERIEVEWLDGFYRGMSDYARAFQVNILGGDTTRSRSDLVINVAVTGEVPHEQVMYRHTANTGDLIAVTGVIGESGAGCEILLHSLNLPEDIARPLIRAHVNPRAHIKEGRLLAASAACSAAIDISDGLSSDLRHLCKESGLGAVIHEDQLPRSDVLAEAAAQVGKDPLDWMLHAGEDYVLLVAIKPGMLDAVRTTMREQGCELHLIGHFTEGTGITLKRSDGSEIAVDAGGWNHFRPEP